MKRKLLLFGLLGSLFYSNAEAQTNLNFEAWTGNEPNGWVSSNALTQTSGGAQTVFKESSNPGQGSASVKMVTGNCPDCPNFSIIGFPAPLPNPLGGGIQLGTFDTPGIPYTQRPISVDFKYKSKPMSNDAGGIHIELTKYDAVNDETETIGEAYFEVNTEVSEWTNINIPIVYYSNSQPERIDIYATSSVGSIPDFSGFGLPKPPVPTPVSGSEFYIDAIVMNMPSCEGFSLTMNGTRETSIGANDGTANVNPSGGAAPYTYSWSNLETSQSIQGLMPGCYSVLVTDANQCQKTATYCVNLGGCNLSVSMSGTNSSSNSVFSGSGSATASASGGNPPYTYDWNTGANTASVSNLPVGTYAVLVSEENNPACAVWGYYTVYTGTTGLNDLKMDNSFVVYPNPSNGTFSISSKKRISSVEILNLLGEKIYSKPVNSEKVDIDLSGHANGIYFYQIKSGNSILKTGKIIIE